MKREIVHTERAPKAIGPYSQAIKCECPRLIFCSGQIPIDPANGELVADEIKQQTRQALENLKAVLSAAGSSLDKVLKTTVFLQNMDDFGAMNEVYGQYFPNLPPARAAVQVARLPRNALVEIEAVAGI